MACKLYIGNLPFSATENDVRKIFHGYEPIHSLLLISDRDTKTSRGFGFVELEDASANAAANELNLSDYQGRIIKVAPAIGKNPQRSFFVNGIDPKSDAEPAHHANSKRTPTIKHTIRRRGQLDINQYDNNAHEYRSSSDMANDEACDSDDFIEFQLYKCDAKGEMSYCGKGRHLEH